jgi:hypothetical protein
MKYKIIGRTWETDFTFDSLSEAVDYKMKLLKNWDNKKANYVQIVEAR